MPLSPRRPAFKITLPQSCLQSSQQSPNNANPVTPVNQRRDSFRPRASVDSWCSTDSGCSAMSLDCEWSSTQIAILTSAIDNIPTHVSTPFVGLIPPQNVLQKIARSVKEGKTTDEWPQSIKTTRMMLHQLATMRSKAPALPDVDEDDSTPPPEAAPTTPVNYITPPTKIPLYCRPSMDRPTLEKPRKVKENANLNRASTRLQARADRFFTFHPYASARPRQEQAPFTPSDSTTAPEPLPPAPINPRQSLRRSMTANTHTSPLATVQEGSSIVTTSLTPAFATPHHVPLHRTSNPCLIGHRVRRSDSFVRPSSMGATVFAETTFDQSGIGKAMGAAGGADFAVPDGVVVQRQTLKRAPSYGVLVQQKKAEKEKEKTPVKAEAKTKEKAPEVKKDIKPRSSADAKRASAPLSKPVARISTTLKERHSTPPPPKPTCSRAHTHILRESKTPPRVPKPLISSSPSPAPTVTSMNSPMQSPQLTETTRDGSNSPSIYSSDEEEKRRAQTIKRFKSMHRPPFLGAPLALSASSSDTSDRTRYSSTKGQTITVEEFTLASMSSMESLDSDAPTLSTSSSVSAFSMKSMDTYYSAKESLGAPVPVHVKEKRHRKLPPPPQVLDSPIAETPTKKSSSRPSNVRSPGLAKTPPALCSTPAATPASGSPQAPRTLRRVGRTPARLDPSFLPSSRPGGLSELSRALSFGGPPAVEMDAGRPSTSSGGALLGAAFSLDSPFEERKKRPTTMGSKAPKDKYLF